MTATAPSHRDTLLTDMFAALDRGDIDGYLDYLAPDASLRFANNPAVVGRQAIKESLQEFYKVFTSVSHTHVQTWPATGGRVRGVARARCVPGGGRGAGPGPHRRT